MPTAGTHITIIERLALSQQFAPLLGDPHADIGDPAGKQMRYAKLGAIGPDIFYALMDYGRDLQDLTNFLTKLAGSFECISEITKDIDTFVTNVESDATFGASDVAKNLLNEFSSAFGYLTAVINEGLMALVIDQGLNFFPIFEARRQQDRPIDTWFWADYLHYVKTGAFVRELFVLSRDNPNLRAFAFGYLSHYVTDVVGHPFVNQVVGAPWRMYWQRHHLVENFIDCYVWDRWHDSMPEPKLPDTEEQPLDKVRSAPHSNIGDGAPFTFARLNDHINVGYKRGTDPVDEIVDAVCAKIHKGLEDIGVAEPDPVPPDDPDFIEWTNMMAAAFRAAYPQPPRNLQPDGYPTPDDVASAYSVLRMYLRVATEDKVKEPEFPNVLADVWKAIKKLVDDVQKNLGSLPPPPIPGAGVGPGFSFEDFWKSLQNWAKWVATVAKKIGQAAFDFIRDAINVGGVLLVDSIKAGLYFVKKALFDIYRAFRFILVRAAYAIPFTDELLENLGGGFSGESLWTTPVEPLTFTYPLEELAELERPRDHSRYPPWVFPLGLMQPHAVFEEPREWVSPYGTRQPPEAFIDAPIGKRTMLSPQGPVDVSMIVDPTKPLQPPTNFGGAIANCVAAFNAILTAEVKGQLPTDFFPDYNLDEIEDMLGRAGTLRAR
jgi:hypothetical protein